MLKMLPPEVPCICGRNSLLIDPADLEARFDPEIVTDGGYTPRYNIAPGDDLHIVTNEAPDEIDRYHWGLIPFWADEPEERIINARSETADEKMSSSGHGNHIPVSSSRRGSTSGKHRTAGRNSPTGSTARTTPRSHWLASGTSGKGTRRRFRA
jgi:hypothetical protein